MRLRWLQDLEVGAWTDLVLVSAVTAVLAIRAGLVLTGYPTVGGDALHVAHMLWGGLLMLIALLLLLAFLGRRVRPVAAVIGGLGFGTFIDEVGKFLTHDNDYFFQPAAAIIYAVLVLLYLSGRALQRRRTARDVDHLANALRDLEEAFVGDLDADERSRILENLDRSDPTHPLVRAIREHLDRVQLVPVARPHWTVRLRHGLLSAYQRLAASRWFARGLIVFFLGQLGLKLFYAGGLLWGVWHGTRRPTFAVQGVAEWGLLTSSVLSGVLVALGVQTLLAGHRARALRRFQASVLVTLLLAQVFHFHLEQWSALTGLGLNLLLFFGLRYALDHERDLPDAPPTADAGARR